MKKTLVVAVFALFAMVSGFAQELKMVNIPGKNFKMSTTEVTQEVYIKIMGSSPSYKDDKCPVSKVSFYDALCFCNKLSVKEGLEPVYNVNVSHIEGDEYVYTDEKDVSKWGYEPHEGNKLYGKITVDEKANGYRLPTVEEWLYAAQGGQNFKYAGSDDYTKVAVTVDAYSPEEVASLLPNGYGLYDMNGNVSEWCWDGQDGEYAFRTICGGNYNSGSDISVTSEQGKIRPTEYMLEIGFRVVCASAKN